MKKFEVHYEIVFEKYDNAVQSSMEVKLGEEMSDPDGSVYKVKKGKKMVKIFQLLIINWLFNEQKVILNNNKDFYKLL